MIVILTLLNVIIHQLINISPEQNTGEGNISPSSMGMVEEEEDLCRCFSLVEIKLATNNFDDKLVIGSGGFGKVYKGQIFGTTVAIKRLNLHSSQGANEFWTEIKTLSKLRHNHLVSLIGYCDQCPEMILVYDYMALGTVGDHLVKNQRKGLSEYSPLTWEQRLNICIGAAQGLDYLHTSRGVIHRDVKSSNILVDENWVAKISDFGLSKMDTTSLLHTHFSTNVKGTFGYLDPKYFLTRRLTKKSDVYAFGVVLFEVLCGRPAVHVELEEQLQHSLALWAQHCFREGTLDQIIDPSVRMQLRPHCLKEFTNIAIKCLHDSPNERPTMTEVVESLKFAMMLWQGGAESYTEDEIVSVGESCKDEQIDGIVSLGDPRRPPTTKGSEIKTKKKVKSSTPKTSKDDDIGKRKNDYGNHGQSLGWWDMLWGRMRLSKTTNAFPLPEVPSSPPKVFCRPFSLAEIRAATHNFRYTLQKQKGYGSKIYMGYTEEMGKIAIRRLTSHICQEFWSEVNLQSQMRCINLVPLVGYCYDDGQMFLVHEYMAKGTLFDQLHNTFNNSVLSWKQRLQICIHAARGLNHLHTGEKDRIVQGNISSSNILLDKNWAAKISSFRFCDRTTMSTLANGYADPEYMSTERLTEKADVYAFGLVLSEVLTGKQALDLRASILETETMNLSEWLKNCVNTGTVDQIIDCHLVGQASPHSLSVFVDVAIKCLLSSMKRLPMIEVVRGLELALELQESHGSAMEVSDKSQLLVQPL
ncbi:receptor-like protein kinase ANXUR1 [Cornus florida]|uniref:receptor-like protein kinase ANXUR1 n=1 Tax=Cornus florida TaxID=4283 RepID=UPI00289F1188|nr:receptor-like protein kinase ANXUR1 [Cornus florida]